MAADEHAADVGADPPDKFKGLVACMTCSLVKTYTQFYEHGCENCPFLEMDTDGDRVKECTSANFDGMTAMMKPSESWVSRWQGIKSFSPGCYAVSVTGVIPDHIEDYLKKKGIPYTRPHEP